MKPFVPVFFFLFCTSCAKHSETRDIAAADTLIASTEMRFIASDTSLTREDYDRLDRHYPKTLEKLHNSKTLTSQDIINMTRAGLADEVIVYEITHTRSHFYLTPDDERHLEQSGVSRRVIMSMKHTTNDHY